MLVVANRLYRAILTVVLSSEVTILMFYNKTLEAFSRIVDTVIRLSASETDSRGVYDYTPSSMISFQAVLGCY